MQKNLYEFYISFGRQDINSAFLLDVERETEKYYFGSAVLLDKKNGETIEKYGRFRVEKENIDCASIHRDTVLVVRTFGDDFWDAKGNAFQAFAEMAKGWANKLQDSLEYSISLSERLDAAIEQSEGASYKDEEKAVMSLVDLEH